MKCKLVSLVFSIIFLYGCASAPQQPISFNASVLESVDSPIGIAVSPIPEPRLNLPGAGCLLCVIAANAANSTLSSHVKTFSDEELKSLPEDIKSQLDKSKSTVVLLKESIVEKNLPKVKGGVNKPKRDYSAFAQQYNIEQLLVIHIYHQGATRPYSSYFPTGGPEASINGKAYIIDLKTNEYLWYKPISLFKAAGGETWDEPPEYPGITNSYYQILEEFRDEILKAISSTALDK